MGLEQYLSYGSGERRPWAEPRKDSRPKAARLVVETALHCTDCGRDTGDASPSMPADRVWMYAAWRICNPCIVVGLSGPVPIEFLLAGD